jgi:hypothetical protein
MRYSEQSLHACGRKLIDRYGAVLIRRSFNETALPALGRKVGCGRAGRSADARVADNERMMQQNYEN